MPEELPGEAADRSGRVTVTRGESRPGHQPDIWLDYPVGQDQCVTRQLLTDALLRLTRTATPS